jgi:hypothetical protein
VGRGKGGGEARGSWCGGGGTVVSRGWGRYALDRDRRGMRGGSGGVSRRDGNDVGVGSRWVGWGMRWTTKSPKNSLVMITNIVLYDM